MEAGSNELVLIMLDSRFLQGQRILMNIVVNMPEFAKRIVLIFSLWLDVTICYFRLSKCKKTKQNKLKIKYNY